MQTIPLLDPNMLGMCAKYPPLESRRWAGVQKRLNNHGRTIVIGAGLAGIDVARRLARRHARNAHRPAEPSSIRPLLYQVVTAAVSPADIAEPIRKMSRGYPSVEVRTRQPHEIWCWSLNPGRASVPPRIHVSFAS